MTYKAFENSQLEDISEHETEYADGILWRRVGIAWVC